MATFRELYKEKGNPALVLQEGKDRRSGEKYTITQVVGRKVWGFFPIVDVYIQYRQRSSSIQVSLRRILDDEHLEKKL